MVAFHFCQILLRIFLDPLKDSLATQSYHRFKHRINHVGSLPQSKGFISANPERDVAFHEVV